SPLLQLEESPFRWSQTLLGNVASRADRRSCVAAALLIQPHTLVETQQSKTKCRQALSVAETGLLVMDRSGFQFWPRAPRVVLALIIPENFSWRVNVAQLSYDDNPPETGSSIGPLTSSDNTSSLAVRTSLASVQELKTCTTELHSGEVKDSANNPTYPEVEKVW
ncbi:unnamed protein product, partial [Timema podura]|nr:unnamed protein product [Timema podura]